MVEPLFHFRRAHRPLRLRSRGRFRVLRLVADWRLPIVCAVFTGATMTTPAIVFPHFPVAAVDVCSQRVSSARNSSSERLPFPSSSSSLSWGLSVWHYKRCPIWVRALFRHMVLA